LLTSYNYDVRVINIFCTNLWKDISISVSVFLLEVVAMIIAYITLFKKCTLRLIDAPPSLFYIILSYIAILNILNICVLLRKVGIWISGLVNITNIYTKYLRHYIESIVYICALIICWCIYGRLLDVMDFCNYFLKIFNYIYLHLYYCKNE